MSRRAVLIALTVVFVAIVLAPEDAGATIEEQRKRLPPPAPVDTCGDPVEGVWMSRTWYPRQREWYTFVFEIHRNGEELTGRIDVRAWAGTPEDAEPKACDFPGYHDWSVVEPGIGTIHDLDMTFTGSSYTLSEIRCPPGPKKYAIGKFAGHIDTAIQEFQSVNHYAFDDGRAFDDITVFRRIRCFGPSTPPPITPPAASGAPAPKAKLSCGCGP